MESNLALTASGLSKSYFDRKVLDDISFTVKQGEVKAIIGASGSGKSTLLRLLSLLEPSDTGELLVGSRRVGVVETASGTRPAREPELVKQRREIGLVFQEFNLFPHMTALDNVMIALRVVARETKADARAAAVKVLTTVGLSHRLNAYPSELSGGEKQRVAIARALVMSPKVLLFDEPTSALDPEKIHEVLEVIAELAAMGVTMIIVTHELRFARKVADRIIYLQDGQIVEDSTPEDLFGPNADERTKQFISHMA